MVRDWFGSEGWSITRGSSILIRAMKSIEGNLVIVGSGPCKRALSASRSKHGVKDRVTILNNVADVSPYYKAAMYSCCHRSCEARRLESSTGSDGFGYAGRKHKA